MESDVRDALTTYFTGEKNAGLLIGIGVVLLAAAGIFLQPRWGLRSFASTGPRVAAHARAA